MERGNPTKEQLQALYDLINKLFEDKDVFYTNKERKK